MSEREELQHAMAALDGQRTALGDAGLGKSQRVAKARVDNHGGPWKQERYG